jgi:hypothetical protein
MSKIKRSAAIYAIVVGVSIIAWWSFFLTTGPMPEMVTVPITAWLHITAEITTGLGLLVSGAGLLLNRGWARGAFLVSIGMLLYAAIQASGYFAQAGQLALTLMFAIFLLLNLFFLLNSPRLETAMR